MVVELVVAELVEASKHRSNHKKKLTKTVASTSSATGDVNIGKLISVISVAVLFTIHSVLCYNHAINILLKMKEVS